MMSAVHSNSYALPNLPTFLQPLLFSTLTLQDHLKDVDFLNCPIRFYTKMETIFSHS
jgi:hypothetical protein